MKVSHVGPYVSKPTVGTGVVWSQRVAHGAGASGVRIHVRVRNGPPSGRWRVCFRDLGGRQVDDCLAGDSPALSSGGTWSGEIPGSGGIVELVADTSAAGLQIEVDRYLYRAVSPPPTPNPGTASVVPITKAAPDIRKWGRSVARLRFISEGRQFTCSAFLVGRDLLLTAQFCAPNADAAATALADFGFDAADATPTTVRISRLESASEAVDYALLRLAQAPDGFGPATLIADEITVGMPLVVIHHPAGGPKQASIECDVRKVAIRGPRTDVPTDFGHLCNTLGGSSGAPVLDARTGHPIGLHHLGLAPDSSEGVKQAVAIGAVLDDLKRHVPAAYAEIIANRGAER